MGPHTPANIKRCESSGRAVLCLTDIGYGGGRIDHFGSFNSRGYPGTASLGYGTTIQRDITLTWHPTMNVPLGRTEASVLQANQNKVTVWDYDDPAATGDDPAVYNEQPTRLLRKIVEQGYTRSISGTNTAYAYTTSFTYNAKGLVTRIAGPGASAQYKTDFSYYSGTYDLQNVTRPLIGATTFPQAGYDAAGFPGQMTDVNGRSLTFAFDGRGRMTEIHYAADSSAGTTAYNRGGDLLNRVDEDGLKTVYAYDTSYGLLSKITEYVGGSTAVDYVSLTRDARGNLTQAQWVDAVTQAVSRKKNWSYDHPTYPGLLWKEIEPATSDHPAAAATQYDYYASGMPSQRTDANGRVTTYEYDVFNRPTVLTQPLSAVTRLCYDGRGNLTYVRDAAGKESTYAYDDMGRLVSATTPDEGTTAYGYDRAGNLTWKTDSQGVTAAYTYDLLDRLTAVSYPAFGDLDAYTVTYTYDEGTDGHGHLTTVEDPSGQTTLSYDSRGRLSSKTSTIVKDDTTSYSYTMSRSFTPGGRVAQVVYPTGRTVDFQRSSCACRVSGITTTKGTTTTTLMDDITYRPFGGASGMGMGSTASVANQFNLRGEMNATSVGMAQARTYGYTQDGKLSSVRAMNATWFSGTFGYDGLGRLQNATGIFGLLTYAHDLAGNRLSETQCGNATTYTYLGGTNRLTSVGSASYDHDACGRVIQAGPSTYSYNQAGQLIEYLDSGTVAGQYVYNGFGQRVKKTTTTTMYHVYDFEGNLAAEANLNGNVGREYLYNGRQRVAMALSNKIYFFHNNYRGTPELMTVASNNTLVWEASYKPFGSATISQSSTIVSPFRLPGQYQDTESGLHYNYFRYYNPKTGRYLTPDPIGLAGGINPYVYVRNDPVNRMDPLGLLVQGFYDKSTGLLTVTDLDTNQTITINAESGGKPFGDPIPNGMWDILEQQRNPAEFRLDKQDRTPYDDVDDATGRSHFRVHRPGRTVGCVAAKDSDEWSKLYNFISNTSTTTVPDNFKPWWKLWPTQSQSLRNFGTLTVR